MVSCLLHKWTLINNERSTKNWNRLWWKKMQINWNERLRFKTMLIFWIWSWQVGSIFPSLFPCQLIDDVTPTTILWTVSCEHVAACKADSTCSAQKTNSICQQDHQKGCWSTWALAFLKQCSSDTNSHPTLHNFWMWWQLLVSVGNSTDNVMFGNFLKTFMPIQLAKIVCGCLQAKSHAFLRRNAAASCL